MMEQSRRVILREGREKSVLRRHPWVFSGSISRVEGSPSTGDTVDLIDQRGTWLARGAYAPESRISARIWTWDEDEQVDEAFIRGRIQAAISRRSHLKGDENSTAYREIFAESDRLPGLIVDRYGDTRVFQLLSPGPERWRETIADELGNDDNVVTLFERSDAEARPREGLEPRHGIPWGQDEAIEKVIHEHGSAYYVDLQTGHKTGFYLDQRVNRRYLQEMHQPGEVLNCFAYTGGFTVAALKAGATRVVSIDSSRSALEMGRRNIELNKLPQEQCEWLDGDVFHELRRFRDSRITFDTIVLDPPRFAPTAAQATRASRGYKDINLLALKLLRPGGTLFTFSCSSGVGPELFQKIVAGAALDAGVDAQIIRWLSQPEDHPVSIHVPESRYLKGLILRLTS